MDVELERLYDTWFISSNTPENEEYCKWWFDGTRDEYLIEEFHNLYSWLLDLSSENLTEITIKSDKMHIGLILALDQLSRNFNRHGYFKPKWIDTMALKYAKLYISHLGTDRCPMSRLVFVLMPFRHQKTFDGIEYVLQYLTKYLNRYGLTLSTSEQEICLHFYKESIKVYNKLYKINDKPDSDITLSSQHLDVLDSHSHQGPCTIDDVQLIYKLPAYKMAANFLNRHCIDRHDHNRSIIISISGGVDSMVLAKIFKQLEKRYNFTTICLHINYNNRPESTLECEFIVKYCHMLNIPIHTTSFKYMVRSCPYISRNFYENEGKKLRFNIYRQLLDIYNGYAVILGHHRGDVTENVFSNMMRGYSLLNLPVMSETDTIDNVPIWRPLYHLDKGQIYRFASEICVPYMRDTTPDWSRRGIMRRQIFPMVEDTFGRDVGYNLYCRGLESYRLGTIVQNMVINPILNSCLSGKLGWALKHQSHHDQLSDKDILFEICLQQFKKLGWKMTSHRSFNMVYNSLQLHGGKIITVSISKDIECIIDDRWLLFHIKTEPSNWKFDKKINQPLAISQSTAIRYYLDGKYAHWTCSNIELSQDYFKMHIPKTWRRMVNHQNYLPSKIFNKLPKCISSNPSPDLKDGQFVCFNIV